MSEYWDAEQSLPLVFLDFLSLEIKNKKRKYNWGAFLKKYLKCTAYDQNTVSIKHVVSLS